MGVGKISAKKDNLNDVKLDLVKWAVVVLLLVGGVFANSYYAQVAWAIRTAVGIVLLVGILAIVLQTEKGQQAWAFVKSARVEMRKVIWPTRQETIQMTLVVIAMVLVAAVILWGLDSLFFWTVSWLTGQRG